jgi:hypothetical protein
MPSKRPPSTIRVWTWNPKLQRYQGANGRIIGQAQMVEKRNEFLEAQKAEVLQLTNRLADKDITWNQWVREMQTVIRLTHMDLYALGSGGRKRVTHQQWQSLAHYTLDRQFDYFKDFAHKVKKGEYSLLQARLYAQQYIGVATMSYDNGRRNAAKQVGLTQERNVLGIADHCEQCQGLERRGWVPLGTLPPPGTRECLGNCRCHLEFR